MLKKRRIILLGCVMIGLMGLVACSAPSEKEIIEELEPIFKECEIIEDVTVDSIEIVDSEKYEDAIEYDICVVSNDGVVSYEKYVTVTYEKNEERKWKLKRVAEDQSMEVRSPIAGIALEGENSILVSLVDYTILEDGESWKITETNVTNAEIIEQTTDLEKKTDSVIVSLVVEDDVMQIVGKFTLDYVFTDKWELESVAGEDTFEASYIQGMELNVQEEDLTAEITKQSFVIKKSAEGTYVTTQAETEARTVNINSDDFSNLKIIEEKVEGKGTIHTFVCEGILKKHGIAEFKIQAVVPYYFVSGNWLIQPISISYEVVSIDIIGDWNGTYVYAPDGGEAKLSIDSLDEEGNITGIYSFTPTTTTKYQQPGSYYVSGKIDFNTMNMELIAGDWIVTPSKISLTNKKQDIVATLYVNDGVIVGTAQGWNRFSVTK